MLSDEFSDSSDVASASSSGRTCFPGGAGSAFFLATAAFVTSMRFFFTAIVFKKPKNKSSLLPNFNNKVKEQDQMASFLCTSFLSQSLLSFLRKHRSKLRARGLIVRLVNNPQLHPAVLAAPLVRPSALPSSARHPCPPASTWRLHVLPW